MIGGAPRRVAPLRRWSWVVLIAAVAGVLFGARSGGALLGAATGAATGGLLSFLEIFALGRSTRRALAQLPFAAYFVLRVFIYVAAIVGVNVGFTLLVGGNPVADNAGGVESGLVFAMLVAVAVNLFFGVNDLLGPGVLFAFVAGRYRRPRRETCALLYLDLCGSTRLAESFGEEKFLDLLNAFFADVTDEIAAEGGAIHKYVGDEVIAVWREGTSAAIPIRACFSARRRLHGRAAAYCAEFGETPTFRAAIHDGAVVIGELGAEKKEIALIGDAMNTAARILEAARAARASVLISADYFARMADAPSGLVVERLPPVAARGKSAPLELVSLGEECDGLSTARRSI